MYIYNPFLNLSVSNKYYLNYACVLDVNCVTTQHNTTQHNTTQHNTTQHNTNKFFGTAKVQAAFISDALITAEMNLKNQQNRLKRPSKTYLGLEKLISVYGNKKFVCGNEKFVYGNEISVHGCKIFVYGNKNSVYGNKKFVYGKIISVLGKKISVYKKKISVVVYKIIQVGFFVNQSVSCSSVNILNKNVHQ